MSDAAAPLVPFSAGVRELELHKLSWRKGHYQVQSADGQAVALLDYTFTGKVEVHTSTGGLRIERPRGVFKRRLEVLDLASAQPIALLNLFSFGGGGGVVLDGVSYDFSRKGLMKRRWRVMEGDREQLVAEPLSTFGSTKARVTFTEPPGPNGLLLVLLVLHLLIRVEREAASAA